MKTVRYHERQNGFKSARTVSGTPERCCERLNSITPPARCNGYHRQNNYTNARTVSHRQNGFTNTRTVFWTRRKWYPGTPYSPVMKVFLPTVRPPVVTSDAKALHDVYVPVPHESVAFIAFTGYATLTFSAPSRVSNVIIGFPDSAVIVSPAASM